VLKKLDEALPHHSGRAQDADWIFVFHGLEHSVYRRAGAALQNPRGEQRSDSETVMAREECETCLPPLNLLQWDPRHR
jgi:hypothetical protein